MKTMTRNIAIEQLNWQENEMGDGLIQMMKRCRMWLMPITIMLMALQAYHHSDDMLEFR